jgi:outer membrane lipoprotein-sorting protein
MRVHATFLAATLVAVLSGPAFAGECPTHVQKIDEALASASLSEEQKAEVQRLRDEGQRLHSEGQHEEALATLAEAEGLLGI